MQQFFSNSSGELYSEAVKGLTFLNANKALWLLMRAAKILFDDANPPQERLQRLRAMKTCPEDDVATTPVWSIELKKIDAEYWEDPDNINKLLTDFAETKDLVRPFENPTQ